MLLGQSLPAPYSGWRFVDADLHDIASRVREYDPDSRLVRNDENGQLGLGVWHSRHEIPGGAFTLAREMFDPVTDAPLAGEPDGRALRCQRGYDSRRFSDIRVWQRQVAEARVARETRKRIASEESFGDHAERYVHAYSKDVPANPRAFIRDRERAVA